MNTKAYNSLETWLKKHGYDFESDYAGDGVLVYRIADEEPIEFDTLPKQIQTWLIAYDTICQHNNNALMCFTCEALAENSATQRYPI